MPVSQLRFGPFSLDREPALLRRGVEPVRLRPKSLEVLRYLAERPGQLVSKEELLKRVWAGRVISDSGLRLCVQEIRTALGDNAETPLYVETVVGRGYRFLEGRSGRALVPGRTGPMVGRESELRRLEDYYQLAADGQRQFVLLSGESGIGKTTLLNSFIARLAEQSTARIIQAQCVAHYGKGEAYGPLLEITERLGRGRGGADVLKVLKRYAPMWLLQLPGLLDPVESERIQSQLEGIMPERMTREFCRAVEELATHSPLVIVIEDLHWVDVSTIDLLAALAQQPEPSRLLLLGTYRPADAVLYVQHLRDIVHELQGHGKCKEMMLEFLSMEDVATYLKGRLDGEVSTELSKKVFQRTNGNPLFIVNLVEDFMHEQVLVRREGRWTLDYHAQNLAERVPESLRSLILRRLEALPSGQRRVLEAASVVGIEFSGAATAGALGEPIEETDDQCEKMAAKGQFIESDGLENWPDGTLTGRYRFQHPLYLEVVYDQIGDARKAGFHRLIGERFESGYGDRTNEIAAALASHFDRARDLDRAIRYRSVAAEQALARYAYPEVIGQVKLALDTLNQLPETHERDKRELDFLLLLGPCLTAAEGYATPEVEHIFNRAQELCKQLEDEAHRATVLWNLAGFRMVRGELVQSRHLVEQFIKLAKTSADDHLDLMAHDANAQQLFFEGQLAPAHEHCEYVVSRYDFNEHRGLAKAYGQEDPGVACSSFDAIILWLLGLPDQSLDQMQACMTLSKQLDNPHSSAFGLFFTGVMYQLRHDPMATQNQADDLIQISADHALPWTSLGKVLRGWAMVQQTSEVEGLALVKGGLNMWRTSGAEVLVPYCFGVLVETQQALGQIGDALLSVAEALSMTEKTGIRWYEAELCRLQGELILQRDVTQNSEAVECFTRALKIARKQQARSLELRTAMSLSRLWVQGGKLREARELLEPVVGWFTEGLETEELAEAKLLLDELVI